ncbi:hypothetical protein [Haliangium sp.]|uniref:hypothetical protein n=1 Tax=Haliangium sp. TaxID=2663208 RepID=UPI003D118570
MSRRCTVRSPSSFANHAWHGWRSRPAWPAALLAACTLGLPGCAQILGIEDVAQSPPDAQASPPDAAVPPDATVSPPDARAIDTSCVTAGMAQDIGITPVSTDTSSDTISASCGGQGSNDQVFEWTAPATDYYVFDTFNADFDTALAIYEECGGAELACSNNVGAVAQSELVRKFELGTQAIIVVDGVANDRGTGELNIQRVACPDVDLEGQSFPIVQSTVGYGDDFSSSCGGAGFEDRAYHFVAPEDALYYFHATSDSFQPIVNVLDGPRCSDRLLGCNTAADGTFGAEVVRRLDAGQEVTVLVDGNNNGGLFTLDIGISDARCPEEALDPFGSTTFPDFSPRVLAPSCSFIAGRDGVGERFDSDDITFEITIPARPATGSGSCDVVVTSAGEFVLYALDDGECRGAETDCVIAAVDPSDPPDYTASVTLRMQDQESRRTVVIADTSPFTDGDIQIDVPCQAIASQ